MKGFDPEYADLPDYILKCTHRIWEGRDINALDWHYGDDLLVRTPGGINRGNQAGKANTMATLTEFPDRELLGEDVIWCGDEDNGFLSSHRILSTATHRGGQFGPATGKSVIFRTIADTFCRQNRVWDEWLIRDNAAIALQLGTTAREAAQNTIARDTQTAPFTPHTDEAGPYSGTGNDSPWGQQHTDIMLRIMAGDFAVLSEHYDRACHVSLPAGEDAHGVAEVDRFWIGLRSALPSAEFRVNHQIGRQDPMLGPRSAIRWSLSGRHDGWGAIWCPIRCRGAYHGGQPR